MVLLNKVCQSLGVGFEFQKTHSVPSVLSLPCGFRSGYERSAIPLLSHWTVTLRSQPSQTCSFKIALVMVRHHSNRPVIKIHILVLTEKMLKVVTNRDI